MIDDGTAIAAACGTIVALSGAVAWLWKAMDKRYQTELAKRDAEFKELKADHKALIQRVRTLEDERVPTSEAHAAKIASLTDRADATENRVAETITAMARAVREIAANVNAQTEAIKGVRCKTFDQGALPDAHPAAAGTDALTRREEGTRTIGGRG
jgi:biopolymer transport protein ExbB/TolQ